MNYLGCKYNLLKTYQIMAVKCVQEQILKRFGRVTTTYLRHTRQIQQDKNVAVGKDKKPQNLTCFRLVGVGLYWVGIYSASPIFFKRFGIRQAVW